MCELVSGRDELHAGEMWNSNSLVSSLVVRTGLRVESILLPAGGRAPGWDAGLVAARRVAAAEHAAKNGGYAAMEPGS